ncbi:MAG: phage portal protein family protein [Phocaeicola sp.]
MSKKNNIITTGGNIAQRGQNTPNTIVLTQPKRFGIDIADFMMAVRAAENVDYSTRYKLYDLYTDIMQDTHLTSVIEKRVQSVLSTNIEFKRDGQPDEKINELISSPWFTSLIEDILAAKWWGFSLMQFYKDEEGWIDYNLIPRKHVDPIKRAILRRQTDILGIPWEEYKHLLFVGDKDELGLLFKAAPWVIYKRNDVADWAQFAEIFGMPIREYIYETDDNEARNRAYEDSKNSGSLSTFIHAKDTELLLKEAGNKTGSADLYERLCERCNSEISKLILGNTLTTEASDKGTQALGTVQEKGENKKIQADMRYVLNVLNYDMSDIFLAMGVNTKGGLFHIPEPKVVDLSARMNILTQLKTNYNLPVSDDYLYETFGVEKPDNYDELKAQSQQLQSKQIPTPSKEELEDEPDNDPLETKQKKKFTSWLKDFFVQALRDDRADRLNW